MTKNSTLLPEKKSTQMNIALSPEDKVFLKTYAAQQDTTVAAVIHEWIEQVREKQKNDRSL